MNLFVLVVAALAYTVITGSVVVAALRIPKTRTNKVTAAVIVFIAFSILPAIAVQHTLAQERAEAARKAEEQKYREAAWAHFQKRCKESAGEKIFRQVENVRGLLLLRRRSQATDAQLRDQYWQGDPYGHDSILPDSEIRNFVGYLNERDLATTRPTSRPGYSYVETQEPHGRYRRYELDTAQLKIVEMAVDKPVSRYGVTWEDISTQEDRKYWVAGGKLQVLDLVTKEVLGERTGYLIEPGFGSQSGGRVPWEHARFMSSDRAACPPFQPKSLVPINRLFVAKVLKLARRDGNGK